MKNFNNEKYVLVIGGCAVDCIYNQNADGSYPKMPTSFVSGGKASNQAVACSLAGQKVKLITRLSGKAEEKHTTELILNNLKSKNVDTTYIEFDDSVDNDSSDVFVSLNGDNNIVRRMGEINSFTPELVDRYGEVIKNATFVIAQMKAPKEFSIKLINFCHSHNVPIVITPCRPEKLKINEPQNLDLINKITLITANKKEFETMFEGETLENALRQFPNKLIVTLGENGCVFCDNNEIVNLPAHKVEKVVDTTGAGDTLNGNLVAGLMSGLSLKDAVQRGMLASALKIQKKTAQAGMPTKEQLDKF